MATSRLSRISGYSTATIIICLIIAVAIDYHLESPALDHYSPLYTVEVLFTYFLSLLMFVLVPVALVTGIKALRRFKQGPVSKVERIIAWCGVFTGGIIILSLVVFLVPLNSNVECSLLADLRHWNKGPLSTQSRRWL